MYDCRSLLSYHSNYIKFLCLRAQFASPILNYRPLLTFKWRSPAFELFYGGATDGPRKTGRLQLSVSLSLFSFFPSSPILGMLKIVASTIVSISIPPMTPIWLTYLCFRMPKQKALVRCPISLLFLFVFTFMLTFRFRYLQYVLMGVCLDTIFRKALDLVLPAGFFILRLLFNCLIRRLIFPVVFLVLALSLLFFFRSFRVEVGAIQSRLVLRGK